MGITAELKQISVETLEIFRQDPALLSLFFNAQWLPESPIWQQAKYLAGTSSEKNKQKARAKFEQLSHEHELQIGHYSWQSLKQQFLDDWEVPALDLHKYFPELTYLLAGYVPGSLTSIWTIPELRKLAENQGQKDFFSFLVVENSEWDDFPLVNAIFAGIEIDCEADYGRVRYLLTDEVGQILDGLLYLSEEGFQDRYERESQKEDPFPLIDWEEEEMFDWLTDYYNNITDYYETAFRDKKAMLLYLT